MIAIDGSLVGDVSVLGTKAVLFVAPLSDGTSAANNAVEPAAKPAEIAYADRRLDRRRVWR